MRNDTVERRVSKKKPKRHDAFGTIVLNTKKTKVHWTDGDSFKVSEGQYKGKGTRLVGYNALEAYGPVHSWGDWSPAELFELAERSAQLAASQEWVCTTDGQEDGYHRLLINCPSLAVEMARTGYGLAYAVEGDEPVPAVLSAQREAITGKLGMWKKGVVKGVITSLHSVGEDGDEAEAKAYNRVVDTRTGRALRREHTHTYRTCEQVCEDTEGEVSCMVYVPFSNRYRDQPDCLK
jgi:endonuclease YncB( thermonuclease family)